MDPTAMVRASVIVGACRLLSCFWDMLPVSVIRDLLTLLVSDLAFDSSSINVRVAVIQVVYHTHAHIYIPYFTHCTCKCTIHTCTCLCIVEQIL